jgi:hypothetical protein
MKFKKLLIESVIDDLDLSKLDKGILKFFNVIRDEKNYTTNRRTGDITNSWDLSDGEKIIKVAKHLNYYDYDHLLKVYKFYQRYKDILFVDLDIDSSMKGSEFNYDTDKDIVQPILLTYYNDNYVNTRINVGGFEWEFSLMDLTIEEAIGEGFVNIQLDNLGDNVPFNVIWASFIPTKKNGMFGFDWVSQDEAFAEWNGKENHASNYEEILSSGYVSVTPLKDLKESSLKKFFDTLIEKVKTNIIEDNIWMIEEYMEWVESNQPPQ